MVVTLERIEAAAPDQASLTAARKLLQPGKWPGLFVDADGTLLWGECQGSGATPYRMAVALHDLGAKCSCPSRKFPCKHSLALLWWRAEEPHRFVEGEIPEWVSQWLARRRGAGKADEAKGEKPREKKSARAAAHAAAKEAPARPSKSSAAARERNRAARESSILAGLDELDQWIADQFEQGLGAFSQRAAEQCRIASRRLADAKAPGLSTRVEALGALYFATPESARNDLLLRELGGLHLLAEAYRRQDELEPDLRHDVRRMIGWTTTRAELLAAKEALRQDGSWCVLAIRRVTQPDRLVRCETWLASLDADAAPTHAVLVDYVPASGASSWVAPAARGERILGQLVFHRSAAPLTAILAASPGTETAPTAPAVPESGGGLASALAPHPWIGARPLAIRACARRDEAGAIWIADATAAVAVPTDPDHEEAVAPLVDLGPVALHALFDGVHLTPLAAATPLGPWWNEAL